MYDMSGMFALIANDGAQDRMLTATHTLNEHIQHIEKSHSVKTCDLTMHIRLDCEDCFRLLKFTNIPCIIVSGNAYLYHKLIPLLREDTCITSVIYTGEPGFFLPKYYLVKSLANENAKARHKYLMAEIVLLTQPHTRNIYDIRSHTGIMRIIIQKLAATQYDICWRSP